jgi:hypothetical protein
MKNIFLVLFGLFSVIASGQTTSIGYTTDGSLNNTTTSSGFPARSAWYKNLEKYWFYRYRLINDFMVVGDGAGKSIPAQARQMARGTDLDYMTDPKLVEASRFVQEFSKRPASV